MKRTRRKRRADRTKAGGGGFGKMDKAGGGGFGKMDKAGVGAGKIDSLLESEKGAGEEEYRQGKYIAYKA